MRRAALLARTRRAALRASALATGVVAFPRAAGAHLATTGFGPVIDGAAHLAATLEDLLPVVALSLFAGLGGPAAGRSALFALPAAWLALGCAGFAAGHPLLPAAAATLPLVALGALTAAAAPVPPAVVALLAVATGALHGYANGVELAAAGGEARTLVGIAAGAFVAVALVAAFVVGLRAPWARIAVRVAGSWLAAVGLLFAGLALR